VRTGHTEPQDDWGGLVSDLAQQYGAGLSEREAGMRVQGRRVSWSAKIDEVKVDSEHAPGLRVHMSPVELPLPNGQTFVAGHLFLPIEDVASVDFCRRLKRDDVIRFEARIVSNAGVFPAVGFAVDSTQGKVFLELGLGSVKLLG
jgi:hypothetical protein